MLLAASLGGLGPGLLATVLSVALGALLAGEGKASSPALIEAGLFAVVGVFVSWFGEQLRRRGLARAVSPAPSSR